MAAQVEDAKPGILARVQEFEYSGESIRRTPRGLLYVKVKNVGNAVGHFNGVALEPNREKTYPFVGKGYDTMNYSAGKTTLRLMFII